jgi:AcrR family transcriptional regulator
METVAPSRATSRSPSRATKGEQTRAAIVDAALGLFEEVGYDATTMRAIADRAGVSVGNAYYYFDSKEQLIQGFYDRVATEHGAASQARLDGVTGFAERLYGHLDVWFQSMGRYHQFAAAFFRTAADPSSPMSPFSADSTMSRDAAIARFRDVVDGAEPPVPDAVRGDLPELLWLFHMGMILFWVHDRSPGQIATRLAVARTVPMLTRAIDLVDVPELRVLVDDITGLIHDIRTAVGPA